MSGHDHMNCKDVVKYLDDYLDRELSADDIRHLEEHLEECADCAKHMQFERSVLDCVRKKVDRICAPSELLDRIRGVLDDSD